ncbi:PrsW family intramembrane metalloprotease [Tsukamurella sp. 1534]|uniref:PrsW family intramembrane metalloprotease n=1 Tax=Tsukamurella sp. 1534 TaxID=1151061 RepID=UPI000319E5E4|nr:PrsW family intramembrane metalloprotease [Tsukamurella sp. 1534]
MARLKTVSMWVFVVGVVLGGIVVGRDMLPRFADAGGAVAVAVPIIGVAAALVAVIIAALDRSRLHVPAAWALAFAWGAVGACGLALEINGIASDAVNDVLDDPGATHWGAALIGPLDEEAVKGVGIALLLVVYRDRIRRPLQGFALGAFAGLGFQVVENVSYAVTFALRDAQSDVTGALTVSILRALFGFQSHWVYSGLFGLGLILLSRAHVRARNRIALGAAAVALAFVLHFFWNAPSGENPIVTVLLLMVKCGLTLAILAGAWTWMLFEQRRWLAWAAHTPEGMRLAPAAELATLPTRALRRNAERYIAYYYGPATAEVARERQTWLIRELTLRAA